MKGVWRRQRGRVEANNEGLLVGLHVGASAVSTSMITTPYVDEDNTRTCISCFAIERWWIFIDPSFVSSNLGVLETYFLFFSQLSKDSSSNFIPSLIIINCLGWTKTFMMDELYVLMLFLSIHTWFGGYWLEFLYCCSGNFLFC